MNVVNATCPACGLELGKQHNNTNSELVVDLSCGCGHHFSLSIPSHASRPCDLCETPYLLNTHSRFCPTCRSSPQVAHHTAWKDAIAYAANRLPNWGKDYQLISFRQWVSTLSDFNYLCAYCQEQPYKRMGYFVLLTQGGAPTKDNAIPVCSKCDSGKRRSDYRSISTLDQRIERVRAYLLQFGITAAHNKDRLTYPSTVYDIDTGDE